MRDVIVQRGPGSAQRETSSTNSLEISACKSSRWLNTDTGTEENREKKKRGHTSSVRVSLRVYHLYSVDYYPQHIVV